MQQVINTQTEPVKVYNYATFDADLYSFDAFAGVKHGEQAVDFTATTLDGRTVKLSDYFGKPIVLETGSMSCPQYVSRIDGMNKIASEYPEFEFLMLYVREAHPGNKLGEHQSQADKNYLAQRVHEEEGENRTILIDNIGGTAHQAYGSLPNMLFIINADGKIAFRTDWNDVGKARRILEEFLDNQNMEKMDYGFKPVAPPVLFRVLHRSGRDAMWDFFTSLPKLIWGHIKAEIKLK